MVRDFTDDDRGKSVFDYEGNRVGRITDVERGSGLVETDDDSGLTDKIKSALNWDNDEDTPELRSDDVDTINDDEVRLRNL